MIKATAAEQLKVRNAAVKEATRVLTKLRPAIIALQALMQKTEWVYVPSPITGPLTIVEATMVQLEESAQLVVDSDGDIGLEPGHSKVAGLIAEAKKGSVLALQTLATIARVK